MDYSSPMLDAAHRHSSNHRTELNLSELCACFFCRQTFSAADVEEWVEDDTGTALCPKCGIDSVLGSASGYPIHEDSFLKAMNRRWFG